MRFIYPILYKLKKGSMIVLTFSFVYFLYFLYKNQFLWLGQVFSVVKSCKA